MNKCQYVSLKLLLNIPLFPYFFLQTSQPVLMYSLFLFSLQFYPTMYASLLTYLGLFDVPAFRTFFRPAFFASEREFVDLNSGTKSLGKSLSPISLFSMSHDGIESIMKLHLTFENANNVRQAH